MAEAFGIAASAAGFVSLGLEVLKGIISYADAIKARKDELDAISRQVKDFESSLEVIRALSRHPAATHQLAGDKVHAALLSGKQDLEDLRQLLEKLKNDPTQGPGVKAKLKQTQKKMAFPFRRESLDRLQQQLHRANASLCLAIQGLQLDMATSVAGTLSSLEPRMLNAAEEGNRKIHDRLAKIIDGNDVTTSVVAALTTESTAKTSQILHASHEFSDRLNEVVQRNELVYNAILDLAREQQIIKDLVAKPAELRDVCDLEQNTAQVEYEFTTRDRKAPRDSIDNTMRIGPTETDAQLGFISGCICRQYQRTLRRQARFAGFLFTTMESVSRKHLPECRYANYEIEHASKSLSISYSGLRGVLSRAVDISMSLNTGAGGFSISPNITLQLMVDDKQSPIFRITDLLKHCIDGSYNRGPADRPIMLRVLRTGVQRMLEQYLSRKRSPYEVDSSGKSALHRWIDILFDLRHWWLPDKATFMILTRSLLNAGLPTYHCDLDGVFFVKSRLTSQRIKRAMAHGVEETHFRVKHYKLCAPLRKQLQETNLLGQTPFHLAADLPEILLLLMNAGGSLLDMDKIDEEGEYALDYALRLSASLCSTSNPWEACSNCECVKCVNILLAQGWRCSPNFLRYFDTRQRRDYSEGKVSYAAKVQVLNRIAYAGATLKTLGLRFLSTVEIDLYHLKANSVLDYYAPKVAQLLSENGVSIPSSLRAIMLEPVQYTPGKVLEYAPFSQDRTSWSGMVGYLRYSSVYHVTHAFGKMPTTRLPQLLYDLGFHDINYIDNSGYSPLTKHLTYGDPRPSYTLWLIDHGANLGQRLPAGVRFGDTSQYGASEYSAATAAHLALQRLTAIKDVAGDADNWVIMQDQEVDAYRKLVDMVAPLDLLDDCTCGCVEDGCHTFKVVFDDIWNYATDYGFFRYSRNRASPRSILVSGFAAKVSELLQNFPLDVSVWVKMSKAGLRYFTFSMLDLRHTCCNIYAAGGPTVFTLEEVDEIRDEEHERLGVSEQLIRELEVQYDNFQSTGKQGDKFTNFLTAHWVPKMEQVLADLERRDLSARELRAAEEAGVIWDKPPTQVAEEPVKDFEYWMRKLDDIAPSQNSPGLIEGCTAIF
ncbi:hypothetical protein LA080_003453 [Diaporthe eres]|nr:hypothetical protein LA080_003453 [Diaporthe eres]